MTRLIELSLDAFDRVATGSDDAPVWALLNAARHSKHLVLLRAVLDRAAERAPAEARAAGLDESFAALCALDAAYPAAVRVAVAHPHFGAWAATCLRRLRGSTPMTGDLAHLGAVVAAVAVQVGAELTVVAPALDGWVTLPRVGSVRARASGLVRLAVQGNSLVAGGGAAVPVGKVDTADWRPLHRARVDAAGEPFELELDDLDPYRDCHRLGVPGRLPIPSVDRWRRRVADAWHIVVAHHPQRAGGIRAGVTTLVPLSTVDRRSAASATSADAIGAVALTEPTDGLALAVTLVHERGHSTLAGLMDLVPLLRPDAGQVVYSPWRTDPRPLSGLLHGVYAFAGVAGFWRAQRTVEPGPRADFEYARLLYQLAPALKELIGSQRLTSMGLRLAELIRAQVHAWLGEPLPPDVGRLARDLAEHHRCTWRLRNLEPAADGIAELAAACRSGAAPPRPAVATALRSDVDFRDAEPVVQLARRWLAGDADAGAVHLELVAGRYGEATLRYARHISDGGDDLDVWAGLAVAGGVARPEVQRALYHALRGTAGPVEVGTWLGRATA